MNVTYRDAGVDLEQYRESMARLPRLLQRTFSPRVIPLDGGFAGLCKLDFDSQLFGRNYQEPVLVSCTDGVGTKLRVAQRTDNHRTVGIDLVAMCVNDAICCGAEPLFFNDYIAMSQDNPPLLEQLVEGISNGCLLADCALNAGETAIMPDLYAPGDYDLAGFCVGVVDRQKLIDGAAIVPGDRVLGLASSGLHSNGFSLVRRVVFELHGLDVDDPVEELEQTVGQALLTPTTIYARAIRQLLSQHQDRNILHGVAHITGGGLQENIARLLPPQTQVQLRQGSWQIPAVFPWLQRLGKISDEEMSKVFNLGIGLALIVGDRDAELVSRFLDEAHVAHWEIGQVVEGTRQVVWA